MNRKLLYQQVIRSANFIISHKKNVVNQRGVRVRETEAWEESENVQEGKVMRNLRKRIINIYEKIWFVENKSETEVIIKKKKFNCFFKVCEINRND